MKNSLFVRIALCAGIVFGSSVVVLSIPTSRADANILPPPVIMIHVTQDWDVYNPCQTSITDCHQIVRNTAAVGVVAFQFFLYPRQNGNIMEHLTTTLRWPDWWYTDPTYYWYPCEGGISNWTSNGDTWTLDVSWPNCPWINGELFLVGTLLMGVGSPGRLDFEYGDGWGAGSVSLECPPWGAIAAIGEGAVAGSACEYTNWQCGDQEWCIPALERDQIQLVAHVGESASDQVPFRANGGSHCSMDLNWTASWLSAVVVPQGSGDYRLDVTAKATNLGEGTYQDWIQIVGMQDWVARCVSVTFTVEGTSSVEAPAAKKEVRTWGKIKASYR